MVFIRVLSERPGVTSINWMEWGIQIPTDRFILIIIFFL